VVVVALLLAAVWGAGAASGEGATPTPPPNDNRTAAIAVGSLPATLPGTVAGATVEAGEPSSECDVGTGPAVWYTVMASAHERIAIDLAAAGQLEAAVDVYRAVRSQLVSVACGRTDEEGKTSLSFSAKKGSLYYVRVAALQGSQPGSFTLDVFLPTPEVQPPGLELAPGGVGGAVDRIQNVNAAYNVQMSAGTSYIINLDNETRGACVSASLFPPGTRSFEGGSSRVGIECSGYRLFTPGPGRGGRYVIELTPRESFTGRQHYHLQVAVAGPAESAPGISLGNHAHAHGRLDGRRATVLRLYRLEIESHSNLTLRLLAHEAAEFNLQLRNQDGNVIACQCEGSGAQTIQQAIRPGRYYAVVSERRGSVGSYTLIRESRTITATRLSLGTVPSEAQTQTFTVGVLPDVSGPVKVRVDRFSPVFGWQFYGLLRGAVVGGTASIPFTPPAIGRWRAKATFEGTSTASPSSTRYSYELVE
jgi:hypothetical protein